MTVLLVSIRQFKFRRDTREFRLKAKPKEEEGKQRAYNLITKQKVEPNSKRNRSQNRKQNQIVFGLYIVFGFKETLAKELMFAQRDKILLATTPAEANAQHNFKNKLELSSVS